MDAHKEEYKILNEAIIQLDSCYRLLGESDTNLDMNLADNKLVNDDKTAINNNVLLKTDDEHVQNTITSKEIKENDFELWQESQSTWKLLDKQYKENDCPPEVSTRYIKLFGASQDLESDLEGRSKITAESSLAGNDRENAFTRKDSPEYLYQNHDILRIQQQLLLAHVEEKDISAGAQERTNSMSQENISVPPITKLSTEYQDVFWQDNCPPEVGVTLGNGEYPTLRKLFYSKYFQKAKEPYYYSISSFL